MSIKPFIIPKHANDISISADADADADTDSGFIVWNQNTQLHLNHASEEIFSLINGCATLGEIAVYLGIKHNIEHHAMLKDVEDAFDQFLQYKLVSTINDKSIQAYKDIPSVLTENIAALNSENPFSYFDAIFCINLLSDESRWDDMQARFMKLGISQRVIRYPAIETRSSHHLGCSLSHRLLVQLAKEHNLNNILVFEDDALFLDTLNSELSKSVEELNSLPWKLFYLGGCLRYDADREILGYDHILHAKNLTCTHAIAYHKRSYKQILNDIPDNLIDMFPWVEQHAAIDQYLTHNIDHGYLAHPTLSIQPITKQWEDPLLQERYY